MNLVDELKKNPFVLAPMAGITDNAFRGFMKDMGVGIVVSELVSAHGISHKGKRTLDLLRFDNKQRPVGMQLFGEDPGIVAEAAKYVEDLGVDFIDLNFGCPVPKVVKKGAGSAMLKDLKAMAEMLSKTKSAISIPLTIKIRTGWDQSTRNASEVAHLAYEEGITWVAIHGRTRAQGYTGSADWEYIKKVKETAKVPILGNGDIHSAEDANQKLNSTGCDGVLIGRGCLKNPWIFLEARGQRGQRELPGDTVPSSGRPGAPTSTGRTTENFSDLFTNLFEHLVVNCDERVLAVQYRKFAVWFSSGYPGASSFRKALFLTNSIEDLKGIVDHYFMSLRLNAQADTSGEAFLMGGHG